MGNSISKMRLHKRPRRENNRFLNKADIKPTNTTREMRDRWLLLEMECHLERYQSRTKIEKLGITIANSLTLTKMVCLNSPIPWTKRAPKFSSALRSSNSSPSTPSILTHLSFQVQITTNTRGSHPRWSLNTTKQVCNGSINSKDWSKELQDQLQVTMLSRTLTFMDSSSTQIASTWANNNSNSDEEMIASTWNSWCHLTSWALILISVSFFNFLWSLNRQNWSFNSFSIRWLWSTSPEQSDGVVHAHKLWYAECTRSTTEHAGHLLQRLLR